MKKPKLPGVIGGLGITFKTMLKPAVTVQYPHEREDQLQSLAWKVLIPLGLLNLLLTGVFKVWFT